jgi:hypothetical protein
MNWITNILNAVLLLIFFSCSNSEPEKQKRKLKRKTDEVINEQTTEGALKGTD